MKSEQQSLKQQLFQMTWPMLFGVLSLMSFQLADSFFIARLGVEPLAVVGLTIPIYQLIIGVQVGIGIATTALISQRIGSANIDDAQHLGSTILLFGTGTVAVLCTLIWLFRSSILASLGGSPALLPLVEELWSVFLPSALTGAFLYFGYSICRAHGNTLLPGIGMVMTSLLNMGLDPLFIFYFEFGLQGAAWASLCSFAAGLLLVYPKVLKQQWVSLSRNTQELVSHIRGVVAIAAPAMTSQLMPAFSAMLATYVVAGYGTATIAAWGVGIRLEFFAIVLILAMTMSLPPMIGRLYGAGDMTSIQTLVGLSLKFAMAWQIGLALILFVFAEPLSRVLSNNPEVAPDLAMFIKIIPLSYSTLGITMLLVSISNAIGEPNRALLISFVRLFVCFLPCIALGSALGGFTGLLIGAFIGNVLAGWSAWQLFQAGIKKASIRLAH